ncbi:hypothetical protein AeMF1_011915 [Aphanomyces euteiches]|nr:hypothetical protein AeMF1_011915 [Aphanomyces euteiches]KAH9163971.1 hypothetical protein AeNC1_018723 [Aphanomyces euteiches]
MSRLPPLPTLALHRSDRIRLFNFPKEACEWITDAVNAKWPHKNVSIIPDPKYVELKLGGYPWSPSGEDTVHARRLMQQILLSLRMYGYALYCSTGIFNDDFGKDVLVFELREPCALNMFSISLNQHDTLRVIDAPPEIAQMLTNCINTYYEGGSVRVSDYTKGCLNFKLWSSPWTDGYQPFGTMIVGHLLAHLSASGWRLYAAINQLTKDERNSKDTWYYSYEPEAKLIGM